MEMMFFRNVRFPGDWEANLVGQRWNVRVGRSQVALWRDFKPLFCWLRQYRVYPREFAS